MNLENQTSHIATVHSEDIHECSEHSSTESVTITLPTALIERIRWYVTVLDEYDSIEDYFLSAITSSADMDMDYTHAMKKKMPYPGTRFGDEYLEYKNNG